MATFTKIALAGSIAFGLAACSETSSRFNNEAGAFLDEGGFGNPTMHNMMVQTCNANRVTKGYTKPDPVVVLDPKSDPTRPTYYRDSVACQGQLNGKYAQVIFREYVTSAEPAPSGNTLTAIDTGGGG